MGHSAAIEVKNRAWKVNVQERDQTRRRGVLNLGEHRARPEADACRAAAKERGPARGDRRANLRHTPGEEQADP
jgi:hypothetical protein